jgi:hypothetical protein
MSDVTPTPEVVEEVQIEDAIAEAESQEAETPVEEAGEVAEGEEGVQAETEEEFKEEVQDAIEDGATPDEVQDMIKEFELKVNGKSVKKTLDLGDEDAIKAEMQKALVGQQAMQEVAELKKMYETEIEKMKADPFEFLKEYDLDPDELAENRIKDRIKEMEKSPEEREREELRRELEAEREKNRKVEAERKEAELEKLQKEYMLELDNDISTALAAHKSLPKTQKSVSKVAEIMLKGMEAGYDVKVDQAVKIAENEIMKEFNEYMDNMPVELMEKYIGKAGLNKLRQKKLDDLKKKPTKVATKTPEPSVEPEGDKKREKKPSKDFFRNLR